jgi:hypothetical protein
MSAIRFHSVNPENLKTVYGEFDNIDFVISALDRSIIMNSIRLNGEVSVVYPTGTNAIAPLNAKVAYDGFIGSHCFIDRIDTSSDVYGNIENLSYYPRMQSAKAQATLTKDDLFNSTYVCENRVASEQLSNIMLKGMVDASMAGNPYNADFTTPLSFSLKLDFCLNSPIGENMLPYAKTGDIRVKLTLARNLSILFGNPNIGVSIAYQLKNLRLTFESVPDTGKYAPQYTMRIKTALKTSIQSSFANISTKVPMVCDRFWATAILQSEEDNASFNGMQNERIPNVSELQILWNDAMTQQLTYTLRNEEEILHHYLRAIGNKVGKNDASLNTLASNQGWGMGLLFGQLVDLSKSKLGLNITSTVSSGAPYSIYLFFSGILSL